MATTTPTSGWDVPTSTDYVKDGASAIETLGDDIDATLWTALGGAYPGLRLVKKQTIGSAVSAVTVTGAFSTTYENYKIIVSCGAASTSNYARITLGSTATGYYQKGIYGQYTNNTVAGAGYANNTSFEGLLRAETTGLMADFSLYSPFTAKNTGMTFNVSYLSTTGYIEQGGGFLNDTNSYTAFTLTANTGTWTGGTIYVYGYGAS